MDGRPDGETPGVHEMSALAPVVREVELHASQQGWDQPAQLFALVNTAELLEREPGLADALGVAAGDMESGNALTPVQQDIPVDRELELVLTEIAWPAEVFGCAAVVERVVLPPEVDAEVPEAPEQAAAFAASHPDAQEVRIAAAVTRAGDAFCALRLRSHDDDESVVGAPDLVPGLIELLRSTLETDDE